MGSLELRDFRIGSGNEIVLIAGPCVIENRKSTMEIAAFLADLTSRINMPLIFKASYDKANRTSIESFRGPGLSKGLDILAEVKEKFGIPVISDVHRINEVEPASRVLDVIQIPAFLCRQTDLILEVAGTGKIVNIKKGQFLAPWDMEQVGRKISSVGNDRILITERGSMFGYNNLVVDFRGIKIIQDLGYPVVFDATHSVQTPGGMGERSGGKREFAPILARAAVAAGADAVFMEVHPDPDKALCDGPNSLELKTLEVLLPQLSSIRKCLDMS